MAEQQEKEKVPCSDAETYLSEPDESCRDFIMQQTMMRIKDPKRSLDFYSRILGMRLLKRLDFPAMKFSLYFMGYERAGDIPQDETERTRWTLSRKATVELTHNWGTEDDPEFQYHNGNKDPKGFGHIGIAVPDVYKACERFEKLGVNFVKKPDDGILKGLAFITDPDGYWIEVLNVEHGQYDQSIELAERYHDFHLLVHLCQSAGDRERLKSYVARFAEQGFAEFLFKHHLDQGNIEELLSYSDDFPEQLAKFLEPHDQISWLHHLATEDFPMAYKTLRRMARREEKFLGRKRTLLSLGKLALLASDPEAGAGEIEELNRELSVVEYQRNVPDAVLEALEMDMETMPPLAPYEIVQLYVGERNERPDENDFLHALELLQIAYEDRESDGFTEVRTYIWSQAALRDNWSQMSTDNPLEQIPNTLLFRVVQKAFFKEFDLGCVLPTVEHLLSSPSLLEAGVAQDTHFRFLISAGFEQLERLQSSETA